jgi:colanic acid/amylovoran biosynthesis glycosyltransferase
MRILVITEHYPVPYKPYYDTQFGDFIENGHDVQIYAAGSLDGVVNEKVEQFSLLDRTHYYPATLREVAGVIPRFVKHAVTAPVTTMRALTGSGYGGVKFRISSGVRHTLVAGEQPDIVLVHGLGTAILFPALRDQFPGIPLAMYYHGGEVPSVREWTEEATVHAFRMFDVVFTNTMSSRGTAIDRGCPPEIINVMPVGLDLRDFTPPEPRRYRAGGVLRLLSAGRMSEEKGFIYALQALDRLVRAGVTGIHYSLTGEGSLRPELEAFVRENGLEANVSFLGTLSTEGVLRAMAEADALLLPSITVRHWVENQACAVQEAMLFKTLVLTSRTGGVPESIPPQMKRFSFGEKDVDGLTAAISALEQLNVEEMAELGEQCRDFVVENYDIRSLNRRLLSAIEAFNANR